MKTKVTYCCSNCGREEYNWLGQCPDCKAWNTFLKHDKKDDLDKNSSFKKAKPIKLADVEIKNNFFMKTKMSELDRVLGGGIAVSASILIGGEPGIGKSTLLLQIALAFAKKRKILYVSGEENESQIKIRTKRLKSESDDLILFCENKLENIILEMERVTYDLVIVDSIQTIYSDAVSSPIESVMQLRHCTSVLNDFIKGSVSSLVLAAHVTKDGNIAGPKVLEHIVDVVLYLQRSEFDLRFLKAYKNRFASSEEIGIFCMTEHGLEDVKDTNNFFLTVRDKINPPGVIIVPIYEGSRVLLVEIQVLCTSSNSGLKIYSDKIDSRRVARVAAILEEHVGILFSNKEIFVNVAGGIKVYDVASDLALAMALFSARSGLEIDSKTSFIAELSLSGELKQIRHFSRRKQALEDIGFKRIYSAKDSKNEDDKHSFFTLKELVLDLKKI